MFRLFLILFLCVVFSSCSSDDDSEALNEWFKDRGIVGSYRLQQVDIDLSVKSALPGANTPAFLVSSSAVLGNANGIEQSLYFGLVVSEPLASVWNLRADSIFYADFYSGNVPEEHKKIEARFYWLIEPKTEHDTTWLKFQENFTDSADISINAFSISLPEKFLKLKADTLRLLVGIKLLKNNTILRIAPPSIANIPGLLRVAQITKISDECEQCLHAGVRESLSVAFEIKPEDKIRIAGKPVVFAELILPKLNAATSELGRPVPVYVYSGNGSLEDYRVNTSYVNEHKHHPNLLFWEGDSLRLQVTQSLRNYVNAANSKILLEISLRLGTPMLIPDSPFFFNLRTSRVFSDRFAFASYDFSSALAEPVKLRLYLADFGDNK